MAAIILNVGLGAALAALVMGVACMAFSGTRIRSRMEGIMSRESLVEVVRALLARLEAEEHAQAQIAVKAPVQAPKSVAVPPVRFVNAGLAIMASSDATAPQTKIAPVPPARHAAFQCPNAPAVPSAVAPAACTGRGLWFPVNGKKEFSCVVVPHTSPELSRTHVLVFSPGRLRPFRASLGTARRCYLPDSATPAPVPPKTAQAVPPTAPAATPASKAPAPATPAPAATPTAPAEPPAGFWLVTPGGRRLWSRSRKGAGFLQSGASYTRIA